MILDSDLATLPPQVQGSNATKRQGAQATWLLAVFAIYLAGVLSLQWFSGAYSSEFSGYPDEPAHYVTSTMVWDYIQHFHFQSPIEFAQNYYEHYPKVAIGHWPPVFYLVQALWMLVFSASRASVRIELAITSAALALSIFWVIRREIGTAPAFWAGALCVALPLVQTYSDQEMAEILLTLFCFWSSYYAAMWAASGRARDAALFATFFGLAVLTKGNGWLLAAVPVAAAILTGHWRRLFTRSFLLSIAGVLAVCVPWQLITMQMAERGWEGGSKPSLKYTLSALWEYLLLFPSVIGFVLLLAMVAGIIHFCVRPLLQRRRVTPVAASLLGLLLGVWIFHSIVPAGVEDRKLILAVPAMIFFIVAGAIWVAHLIPAAPAWRAWRAPAVAAVLTIFFSVQAFSIPHLEYFGYDRVAQFLASHPEWKGSRVLISSNSGGEGLLISELAMLQPDPNLEVIRGTKALATVEWNGAEYRCLFHEPKDLVRFIAQRDIRFVIVDRFTPATHYLHDDLVKQMVANSPHFTRVAVFARPRAQGSGEIEVYRSSL